MFVSNTGAGTSHNNHILLKKNQAITFRALIRPVVTGRLTWRFRFSNCVDSTWADGADSWADLPGGRFEIVSCSAGAATAGVPGPLAPVTWSGAAGRVVEPCARFASDPIALDIPRGGHIAFSWCLRALEDDCLLPGTPDSRVLTWSAAGDLSFAGMEAFTASIDEITCLPDAFEADRSIAARMAFLGDSITQGCQTRVDFCEQWAARIALGIERDVAVRNLGLGYGRAADAGKDGVWLEKAAEADIVNMCFGVNDLLHGSRDADVITRDLRAAVAGLRARHPGIKVVLFTVPPFDMTGDDEANWRTVNGRIRQDGLGADAVFDIAAILGHPAPRDNFAFFGGHPDGRGGAAAAGEYLTAFWPAHRDELMPAR